MNSLNKVQLIGNMTAAAEIRETPNGKKVATFSIATNRVWKDAAGAKQEQVEYHNIVVWGGLADVVERYTGKGKKVYAEGYLQTRNWDDQSGVKRYKTEIVAENIILLSPGGASDDMPLSNPFASQDEEVLAEKAPKKKAPKQEEEIQIEDIPF